MLVWDQIVDVLRESIFAYAQLFNGNMGAGILAVSFLARLALLPLGVHLARTALVREKLMAKLQPALDRLKAKYGSDRRRLAGETQRLLSREGAGASVLTGYAGPEELVMAAAVRRK